jgi:ketosteroid isomerase-like protein
MSPGELVRLWWEGGDHGALVAACDADVVWDLSRLDGWDGDPLQRGPDGVRAVLDRLEWAPGGTFIASGDRVLVNAHPDGVSAVVHHFEDGRIVRLSSITDHWDAQVELTGTDPIAVVRAVWVAWEARDMDRVLACFADDVVFDLSHYEAWKGAPRYDGPTSMIRFLAEWMSWWHGYHQEVVGDELHGRDVLLLVRHSGDREGTHVEEVGGLVYAVRPDGRIDRWTVFPTPELVREWIELRQAPAETQ